MLVLSMTITTAFADDDYQNDFFSNYFDKFDNDDYGEENEFSRNYKSYYKNWKKIHTIKTGHTDLILMTWMILTGQKTL